MAHYLVSLYGSAAPQTASQGGDDLKAHEDYAKQIEQEGVLVYGAPVNDPTATVSLGPDNSQDTSSDPSSLLLGIYVVKAFSADEALAIAQRNPILNQGGYLEVRELADTGQD